MNVQSGHSSTLQDFQIIQELGSGSFSNVYRVKRIADGQEYALKKVKISNLKQKEKQNALNEVRLLASINDKHIVAYKEAFIDEPSSCLCIVMELLSGGDVYKKIAQARGSQPFQEMDIWKALIHMTLGLKALHDQKVVHRDLKSANVFLSSDGTFKLGDLNVSKVVKGGFAYTQTGTPYYASPEVWRDQPYDMKSDIWSLGCVVYEMCCLQTPFRAKDMDLLFQKVQKGTYEQIPSNYSKELSTVISQLLKIQPNQRPSCDQILANPTIQKYMKNLETSIETKPVSKQLLETIQFPNNFKQLKNQMPKSKYDEVHTNVSVERVQDNKSTDKSTSPFRYPQSNQPNQESRVSQSQVNVINVQQQSPQLKNSSVLEKNQSNVPSVPQGRPSISNKTEKPQSQQQLQRYDPYARAHELKEQQEKDQKKQQQLLKEKREKDIRDAKEAKERERQILEQKERERQYQSAKEKERQLQEDKERERIIQEAKIRESRVQLDKNDQVAGRRVSPISVAQQRDYSYANYVNQQQLKKQHSYSPITRSVDQQQLAYNGQRINYGNQIQQRPQISQSINLSQNVQPNQRPYDYQTRPSQTPQSAAPRQQQYSPFQKPVTERYQHPQSALPSNVRDQQKTERPQVFPAQAKVIKSRQSEYNQKKEFQSPAQPIRPAGKPSRPQSTNIFQSNDRGSIRQENRPQQNLLNLNYNHYYPIDNYQNYQRHASDQNLIKYQLRQQDKQSQLRAQINSRKNY